MTTQQYSSTSANVPEGRHVTTKSIQGSSITTSSAPSSTGYTVVRSSKSGMLRYTYDTKEAARQRSNLTFNRGPDKVSTDK